MQRLGWERPNETGFATLAISRVGFDDRHQSFAIDFPRGRVCDKQTIEKISEQKNSLIVEGTFLGFGCSHAFVLTLAEAKSKDLEIRIQVKHDFTDSATEIDRDVLRLERKLLPPWPAITLHGRAKASEAIYGGGAQLTYLDLKGRYVPLIVREPGIGRGRAHPLLRGLDLLAPGAKGDATSTSAPSPVFVTSENRGFVLDNYEPAAFDFRSMGRASVVVRSDSLRAHILPRASVAEALTAVTDYTGRMKPLPDWFNRGATIGIQGGPAKVMRALERAKAFDVPVAGVWVQDWVGRRQIDVGGLPVGSFLWWIWEADQKLYPDWNGFVETLAKKNVRTLAYMNPYLVDATEKAGAKANLFADAERNGYLVRNAVSGRAWIGNVIMFPAALVDLSNPRAFEWMKSIVKERLVASGVRGMMADFGEALPFEARLSVGRATEFHNRFAE
ncbi:MAG: TIM-barrel domain-containing protein, partial [Bdellovibrionota bacterium]